MMIIKAPIGLKVRTDLMSGYDAFAERIAGNYALMGLEIGEEELLHMVSSPPEIYLMDGGSVSVGGSTFISSRNEEKYNIVNNMLNRILLSYDGELSYQDRVYITDALYKLGVKDDRKFMTQVRKMIEESRLEEDFLSNYFEMTMGGGGREVRERTLELSRELAERDSYHTEETREDFLSERILHRLRTGAIYQIVSNFNKSLSDTRVELQESMLSEQENVARRLLVQNFLSRVVKANPELVLSVESSRGAGAAGTEPVRQVQSGRQDSSGESIPGTRTGITERSERELRENELRSTERENLRVEEHDTLEMIHRREGEPSAETPERAGEPGERVIVEHTFYSEPETREQSVVEHIPADAGSKETGGRREETEPGAPAGESIISREIPGEKTRESFSSEETRITERRDSARITERTDRSFTGREETLSSDHEKTELIFREGAERESKEETLLERLEERLNSAGERSTSLKETELQRIERTEALTGQERLTERLTEDKLRREERIRPVPGEEVPGEKTEKISREETRITSHRETEHHFEDKEYMVTEPGEILRTEHEGAELIFREGEAGTSGQETEEAGVRETLRERETTERERIREREGQPRAAGEGTTVIEATGAGEVRTTTAELREAEYHTRELLTGEQTREAQSASEEAELSGEAGRRESAPGEVLRESSTETRIEERASETERLVSEERTEHTDRYVTEQEEILRTEHAGAELIFREGEAATSGQEEEETGIRETLRERETTEQERIREREGQPQAAGERTSFTEVTGVGEVRTTATELREAEYHTRELLTEEQMREAQSASVEEELSGEAGRRETAPGEVLRESSTETRIEERASETERLVSEERTEHSDRYVTEQEEILRTEHAGAELIFREGEAAISGQEEEEAGIRETLRERETTEQERIREREGQPQAAGEKTSFTEVTGVGEVRTTATELRETEYHTRELLSGEQTREAQPASEESELPGEAGRRETAPGEVLRESSTETRIEERAAETERLVSEERTEHTDRYVTEPGEILRTEHAGAELIFREGEAENSGQEGEEAGIRETLRERETTEQERIREREGQPQAAGEKTSVIEAAGAGEARTTVTELREAEYHTIELRTGEQTPEAKRASEEAELSGDAGSRETVPGEVLRESSKETRIEELTSEMERLESELSTTHRDRYVTEPGEILRTEHAGAELIFREGEAMPSGQEGEEAGIRETLRERETTEQEQIREKEGQAQATGERTAGTEATGVGEVRTTATEQREAEYHEREIRTEEQPQEAKPASVGTELPLTEERKAAAPGEVLRESSTETRTTELTSETDRLVSEERTEHTDRYVTEPGEILRTEHEGAELIFREGETAASGQEREEAGIRETLRERETTERERIRESRELPREEGERRTETRTERVTEERSTISWTGDREYRTSERETSERETLHQRLTERTEALRETGTVETVTGETIREKTGEQIISDTSSETLRTEAEIRTEQTDRYVTEPGEILRTEHEASELIYREGTPAAEEGGEAPGTETLRESYSSERERISERDAAERELRSETRIIGIETRTSESRITEEKTGTPGAVERREILRETRSMSPEEGREIRESREERILSESTVEREPARADAETGSTDRYVTEPGEILRRTHEETELIFQEGREAEPESTEGGIRESLRETERLEERRLREQERLEKERISQRTREEISSELRTELRERLESERISGEAAGVPSGEMPGKVIEQAEIIYREEAGAEARGTEEEKTGERIRESRETERERLSERERLERERSRTVREETSSLLRSELREQLKTEQLRTESVPGTKESAAGRPHEQAEMIFRETAPAREEERTEGGTGVGTHRIERYRSDNVYERELMEREQSRTEMTSGLTAAVLLDVVRTLFHAGSERIGKGDTWIEYRGALYHSARNIFSRLNYSIDESTSEQTLVYPEEQENVSIEHTDISELQEVTENAEDLTTIENMIREMNEMNLQNVERYQQMVRVLKTLQPERRRTGGMERTRQEALSLLDDEQSLYESLRVSEGEQEEERREVFHEITRLFPDHSVEVFRMVEQYLEGNGQPGRVGVTRNNVEAAAEEIRRITAAPAVRPEPQPEPAQVESSELVYRRNERVTQEELEEMVESLRSSGTLQRREIEQRSQQLETDRRNTYSVTTSTERILSQRDAEDIEAMVTRGVRSQMNAISDQVLQKLEKKLKNEKIRRGI